MTALDWLYIFGVGAVSGMIGQGIRVVVGLKKTSDTASATGSSIADLIRPSRLVISLLIGAIAGILCAAWLNQVSFTQTNIFTIAAAGYAGADFIEGFMQRVGGAPGAAAPEQGAPEAAQATDDAVG